ncbi:MAG: SDR family oxidoreductase [Rhizobiales bacterium]|nr:SDR family oxidoreductase [Hyphomicrobiales bacterium]
MRFDGKVALVTGGYRGMGGASARDLAREGATVIAADVIAGTPPDAARGVTYRQLDVTSVDAWDGAVAEIMEAHGRIDVLVNAAGVAEARSEPHDTDLDEWARVVAVNQTGVMLGMRTVCGAMLGRGNLSIVNISSIWGLVAGSGQLAYHASKGAVTLMTLNAAVTYAARGIRVNAVLPGLIETEMVREQDPAMRAETIGNTPMKRVGMPEEVARAILFLASDEASYITGALLPVDGGYTAR